MCLQGSFICNASAVVVLMSSDYEKSWHCQNELKSFFGEQRKPAVFVQVEQDFKARACCRQRLGSVVGCCAELTGARVLCSRKPSGCDSPSPIPFTTCARTNWL